MEAPLRTDTAIGIRMRQPSPVAGEVGRGNAGGCWSSGRVSSLGSLVAGVRWSMRCFGRWQAKACPTKAGGKVIRAVPQSLRTRLEPGGVDFAFAGEHVEILDDAGQGAEVRCGSVRQGVVPNDQVAGASGDRNRL